ncbi:hypothetical protein ACFWSF_21430 [Streptomyces sp. NPDC058611]|uniref:hypothetical protein n=1 Tax=unclassified Streptomyces TaxID=2593676 RepID=UPI0036630D7E
MPRSSRRTSSQAEATCGEPAEHLDDVRGGLVVECPCGFVGEEEVDLAVRTHAGADCLLTGNAALLRQLVTNLLDDAVGHNVAGGEAQLAVYHDDGLVLEVENTVGARAGAGARPLDSGGPPGHRHGGGDPRAD